MIELSRREDIHCWFELEVDDIDYIDCIEWLIATETLYKVLPHYGHGRQYIMTVTGHPNVEHLLIIAHEDDYVMAVLRWG